MRSGGKNYFHNNTEILFALKIVLVFALMAQNLQFWRLALIKTINWASSHLILYPNIFSVKTCKLSLKIILDKAETH
jgi:hypothetical protein